jgi:hypothetical protein
MVRMKNARGQDDGPYYLAAMQQLAPVPELGAAVERTQTPNQTGPHHPPVHQTGLSYLRVLVPRRGPQSKQRFGSRTGPQIAAKTPAQSGSKTQNKLPGKLVTTRTTTHLHIVCKRIERNRYSAGLRRRWRCTTLAPRWTSLWRREKIRGRCGTSRHCWGNDSEPADGHHMRPDAPFCALCCALFCTLFCALPPLEPRRGLSGVSRLSFGGAFMSSLLTRLKRLRS